MRCRHHPHESQSLPARALPSLAGPVSAHALNRVLDLIAQTELLVSPLYQRDIDRMRILFENMTTVPDHPNFFEFMTEAEVIIEKHLSRDNDEVFERLLQDLETFSSEAAHGLARMAVEDKSQFTQLEDPLEAREVAAALFCLPVLLPEDAATQEQQLELGEGQAHFLEQLSESFKEFGLIRTQAEVLLLSRFFRPEELLGLSFSQVKVLTDNLTGVLLQEEDLSQAVEVFQAAREGGGQEEGIPEAVLARVRYLVGIVLDENEAPLPLQPPSAEEEDVKAFEEAQHDWMDFAHELFESALREPRHLALGQAQLGVPELFYEALRVGISEAVNYLMLEELQAATESFDEEGFETLVSLHEGPPRSSISVQLSGKSDPSVIRRVTRELLPFEYRQDFVDSFVDVMEDAGLAVDRSMLEAEHGQGLQDASPEPSEQAQAGKKSGAADAFSAHTPKGKVTLH